MGIIQDVADDGFAGLEHNFVTGKVEDVVLNRHPGAGEALVDFDRTFEDDHETGLRIAERARGTSCPSWLTPSTSTIGF